MPEYRFRADMRLVYAQALKVVVEYARRQGDFYYGPVQLDRLENEGLVVSGPGADGIAEKLRGIVGLTEVDA